MTTAKIYLHWGNGQRVQSQPPRETPVKSIAGDHVTLEDEWAPSGEAVYSLKTGHRLGEDLEPHWDLWRLDRDSVAT